MWLVLGGAADQDHIRFLSRKKRRGAQEAKACETERFRYARIRNTCRSQSYIFFIRRKPYSYSYGGARNTLFGVEALKNGGHVGGLAAAEVTRMAQAGVSQPRRAERNAKTEEKMNSNTQIYYHQMENQSRQVTKRRGYRLRLCKLLLYLIACSKCFRLWLHSARL